MLDWLVYAPDWMSSFDWAIIVAFILAFGVSYGMGANDACNDWGTSVGAGTVKLWQAYILCSIFNTLGAILLGYKVAETIRSGIVEVEIYDIYVQYNPVNRTYARVPFCMLPNDTEPSGTTFAPPEIVGGVTPVDCARYTAAEYIFGQMGALCGVAVFMIVSSIFKIPVSATHAIVGATLASSLYLRGNVGIKWMETAGIVASWFISPVISGAVASLFYLVVKFSVLLRRDSFDAAINLCPVFMAFTLTVNLYACIYDGSKYLGFDKLNWWQALLVSLASGVLVGLIVHFPLRSWLRYRAQFLFDKEERKKAEKAAKRRVLADGENNGNKVAQMREDMQTKIKTVNKLNETLPWYEYIWTEVPEDGTTSKVFNALQMVSASLLSFSHGANDTANTVGPLCAIWLTFKTGYALTAAETRNDMQALLAFGAVAMIAGFVTLGHRTIKLIAKEITVDVSAPSGFCVELGTAFTVLVCAKVGIPVSSTHCAVGAVLFVGMTKSTAGGVNWKCFRKICVVWLLCLPISAAISFATTYSIMLFM